MTAVSEQLYRALTSYPCRCVLKRTDAGRPLFDKGERTLEKTCSRCIALRAYEDAYGETHGKT